MFEQSVRGACFSALAASAALVSATTMTAAEGNDAARLVAQSGIQGGLIVHVESNSPEFTAGLRVSERYVVQALHSDPARVAADRTYFARHELAGPLSAVPYGGDRLPYAESMINLLIVESSAQLPAEEIERVLAPLGVAYVESDGGWSKTSRPWPEEIDQWTHVLHAPDNNAVATHRPRRLQRGAAVEAARRALGRPSPPLPQRPGRTAAASGGRGRPRLRHARLRRARHRAGCRHRPPRADL